MRPPCAVVLRQQLDPPVVVGAQRGHQRRELDDEALVPAGVAHRVHRPQDRPEPVVRVDLEGIPVRRPLAEPVPGALTLGDLPVEVTDDCDVAGDVGGAHRVRRHAELGSVGRQSLQHQGAVPVSDDTVQDQEHSFRVDRLADVDLPARHAQHQPVADQPGVDANATREAVAAMVVDQVANTDPESRAAVPLPGLHPSAADGHPKPPFFAGKSMRDQVNVAIAARGLHLGRAVHDLPVLHRIGPERLPEPPSVIGPVPAIDPGARGRVSPLLPSLDPVSPLRQRDDCRQQPKKASSAQPLLR